MTRLNIPLFVALAASLLSSIDARDQLPHQRMIRKRAPAPLAHFEERAAAFVVPRWPGLVERQEPSGSSTGSVSATKPAASGSASASSVRVSSSSAQPSSAAVTPSSSSASAQSTVSASSSSQSGLFDSLTAVLGGSQSSTSAASSTSVSSSSSSSIVSSSSVVSSTPSSVAPSTSQAAPSTPVAQPTPSLNLATTPAPTATNPTQSIAVVYSTAVAPEAAASQAAAKERTRKITKNTIISLVVVASCIGGAIAIWTVIRKWKLSPSERFDDRMQPIDWAPTGGASGVRDDPLAEKASHRRAGSAGSHGSFTSGGVGQSEVGHGGAKSVYSDATGHGNAQYGAQAQDFPPPHDFTAGAGPGAYGQYQGQQYAGAGYADLRRGPSVTESNYSHGTYARGPAYEVQPGAAGVPPMPTNPYGGYEEEYYQPAQGQTQVQGQGQYRGY